MKIKVVAGGILEKDGKFYWFKKIKKSVEENGVFLQGE